MHLYLDLRHAPISTSKALVSTPRSRSKACRSKACISTSTQLNAVAAQLQTEQVMMEDKADDTAATADDASRHALGGGGAGIERPLYLGRS